MGCKESEQSSPLLSEFSDIFCSPDPMPKFDQNIVTLLDENQNPVKDSVVSQIEKTRIIFRPCREMIYRAIWRDKSGKEITNSRVKIMATGTRWEMQEEKQDELIIQYEYSQRDIDRTNKHQLNKGLLDKKWKKSLPEGVIENVERVWMHPIRFNQYNFTEVAPFPEVEFPLSIGKIWTGNLRIMGGWGDWNGTSGSFHYEVKARETIKTNFGTIEDCWRILSKSTYPFGNSDLEYWFHESLGFVKKEYKNYGGQTLSIELEKLIQKKRYQ